MSAKRNQHRQRKRPDSFYTNLDTHGFMSLDGLQTDLGILSYSKTASRCEEMVDTVGYKDCDFNPCWHDKLLLKFTSPSVINVTDSGVDLSYVFLEDRGLSVENLLPTLRSIDSDVNPVLRNYLDDSSAEAELAFTRLVDVTALLENFVIEALEMLEGNIKKLENLSSRMKRAFDEFFSIWKRTGNYWLAWNFAIKPTIKDIETFLGNYDKAKRKLKWLRDHNHLDTKVRHRSHPIEWDGQFEFSPKWPDSTGSSDYQKPESVVFRVYYSAQAAAAFAGYIHFDIADYLLADDDIALKMVLADMLGLFDPLMVAWEAIPFSWLIDWFRSRRDNLRIRYANLDPFQDATIIQACHSVKLKIFGALYVVDSNGERPCGNFLYRNYTRSPGLNFPPGDSFRVPLEWYNASILAAIVAQKVRH